MSLATEGDVGELVDELEDRLGKMNEVEEEEDGEAEEVAPAETTAQVKVLSEEDLDKYTIDDVVLPLPGISPIDWRAS